MEGIGILFNDELYSEEPITFYGNTAIYIEQSNKKFDLISGAYIP